MWLTFTSKPKDSSGKAKVSITDTFAEKTAAFGANIRRFLK